MYQISYRKLTYLRDRRNKIVASKIVTKKKVPKMTELVITTHLLPDEIPSADVGSTRIKVNEEAKVKKCVMLIKRMDLPLEAASISQIFIGVCGVSRIIL